MHARSFATLDAAALLAARELYHVHLSHLPNVTGTAIGRHRFRRSELDHGDAPRSAARPFAAREVRTFVNSVVTRRSWPCVLVLVDDWKTPDELRDEPDTVVPRLLYLPDGRAVPTCVLRARRAPQPDDPPDRLGFASEQLGGGYPVLSDVQGAEHAGVACNEQLGCVTSGVTARNFDVGLVELDDVAPWTAQVFGIGELGEVMDVHGDTPSLELIGCPVRAYGGVSGVLEGEIAGLAYRYRCMAGRDYVTDLLIAPRSPQRPLATRPGDSGTVWFYDPPLRRRPPNDSDDAPAWSDLPEPERGARARRLRPIAMQWGGQRLVAGEHDSGTQVAMATLLGSICRELDVQLVTDPSIGHDEYWGKTAHFKIGANACDLVKSPRLRELMQLNRLRIGCDDDRLRQGHEFRVGREEFVPLADVPDYTTRGQNLRQEPLGGMGKP